MDSKLLTLLQSNRKMYPMELRWRFCGVCESLTLPLPLEMFYTRSLYFDIPLLERVVREIEEGAPSGIRAIHVRLCCQ